MDTLTNLFLTLVKIDSPSGQEEKMSRYLKTWLVKNKFKVKIDSVGNIYAENGKRGTPLLLCAHMDTVEPGKNIKPVIKSGTVKSDGSTILGADNKAAIAAIMVAAEQNNTCNLEIIFSVKEETGGGLEYFPFELIKSKHALVFDSANPLGGIVMGSPYICNFTVEIQGKAAHSSTPQKGINAFVPAFRGLSAVPTGILDGGETTVNIGKIIGGNGINTIPDYVKVDGEIRSYNKIYFETRLENIKNIFHNACIQIGAKSKFTTEGYCDGYSHKKKSPFILKIAIIYTARGLTTQFYDHSGISDANPLNTHGIVAVNLTDGVKNPHTTNEEVAIKDLEMLSRIVVSCINKL